MQSIIVHWKMESCREGQAVLPVMMIRLVANLAGSESLSRRNLPILSPAGITGRPRNSFTPLGEGPHS